MDRRRQPATDLIAKVVAEAEAGQTRLLMSAINVGEVYYFLMKQHGQDLAESWGESLRTRCSFLLRRFSLARVGERETTNEKRETYVGNSSSAPKRPCISFSSSSFSFS